MDVHTRYTFGYRQLSYFCGTKNWQKPISPKLKFLENTFLVMKWGFCHQILDLTLSKHKIDIKHKISDFALAPEISLLPSVPYSSRWMDCKRQKVPLTLKRKEKKTILQPCLNIFI